MKCPFCKADDTAVVDSRLSDDGDSVRRRRQCESCDKRFTTLLVQELPFGERLRRRLAQPPKSSAAN